MRFSLLIVAVGLLCVPAALATSYASGVSPLGGGMYSFVLNEDASNVVIDRYGTSPLNLGPLAKGAHTFDLGAGTGFGIQVSSSATAGWTQISDDSLTQSKYYSPRGVTVDMNPMRSTFGRIYVGESLGGPVGAGGRTTTDGIYVMSADQGDVLGQGDTAFGGGVDWSTSASSPLKLGLNRNDPLGLDGQLYIGDWSDSHSGIWTADTLNMGAAFPALLDNTGRDAGGLVLENFGAGPGQLHGSVPCGPWVEGTGADRKMYTLDEDVRRGNVLRYDIGTTTANYATAPTDVTTDSLGYLANGLLDMVRDENGDYWVAQYRYTESAACPALTRWEEYGTEPVYNSGADGDLPLLWSAYGSIDIIENGEMKWLVMGARSSYGVYILDISDPDNPVLLDTIPQTGYTRDVAFDAAGNVYVVSNSSETLRIWSPGGDWLATTGSDGSFTLVPEPGALMLLALGGLALFRRR